MELCIRNLTKEFRDKRAVDRGKPYAYPRACGGFLEPMAPGKPH